MFKLVEDEEGRKIQQSPELEANEKEEDNEEVEEEEEEGVKRKEREESDEEEEGEELVALRAKMTNLPLAKLAELRSQLGNSLFEKALYGKATSTRDNDEKKKKSKQPAPASGGSKRPREESSARPPPKLRAIKGLEGVGKQRNARFDPRFSAACGQFDEFSFHRDYGFLDEMRQRDIQELKKAFRTAKRQQDTAQTERIRRNLLRLEQQQKASRDQKLMEQVRTELRQGNIERMNRGERPVYLNNYELKERFLTRKRELYGEEDEGEEQHPANNTDEKKKSEGNETEQGQSVKNPEERRRKAPKRQ